MKPTIVTFDCADTLVEMRWHPAKAVESISQRLGVSLPAGASENFAQRFFAVRDRYEEANLGGDAAMLQTFWSELYVEWLAAYHAPVDLAESYLAISDELAYGADSTWFPVFPDTRACLARLREAGYRLAVISNWDLSLHRILREAELEPFFESVIVSLEHGVEKPDPRIFDLALRQMDATADQAIHVGDREDDDVQGAQAAGMRVLRIDRHAQDSAPGLIRSLDELPEAF